VAELQAKLRLRRRQLFGRKSEKGNSRDQNQQKNKRTKAKKAPRTTTGVPMLMIGCASSLLLF
jgi:hypothetical protein